VSDRNAAHLGAFTCVLVPFLVFGAFGAWQLAGATAIGLAVGLSLGAGYLHYYRTRPAPRRAAVQAPPQVVAWYLDKEAEQMTARIREAAARR
jgi:hypothetical protein